MQALSVYRICQSSSGAFLERPLLCNNDEEALATAKMMLRGLASAEVWQGSRLVGGVSTFSGRNVDKSAGPAAPARAAAPAEAPFVAKRTLVNTPR